jgi:hypothetical protein
MIWLTVLLIGGTLFYRNVEGWSWLNSLYFCVITLATVGFGDITPSTTAGKVFTMLYVIMGIGVLVAVVNATVERVATRRPRRSHGTADPVAENPAAGSAEAGDGVSPGEEQAS